MNFTTKDVFGIISKGIKIKSESLDHEFLRFMAYLIDELGLSDEEASDEQMLQLEPRLVLEHFQKFCEEKADYLSGSDQFGCFTMAVKYNEIAKMVSRWAVSGEFNVSHIESEIKRLG